MMTTIQVEESLKSKNDGRKTPWFINRIKELESKLESSTNDSSWADGFVSCMHHFQILNKASRRQIHNQLKAHGPGYVRKLKASKFRGVTL